MPLHPLGRNFADVLKEDGDKIVYADELGFDQAWVGEHFSATTEPITSPMMFMASLLPRTRKIKMCTGVIALPNHHPVIVAGEAAMFDHMSGGRFIMGIGPGGLGSDMEVFGNLDAGVRTERMQESIRTILQIWSQDAPYDIQGKHWPVKLTDVIMPEMGIGFMAKPLQQPHPPLALSSMSPASGSVAFAAKQGWTAVTANFVPEATVISHWEKYVEGCEAGGHTPDGKNWSVARNLVIGDSDAEAEDWLFDPDGSSYFYFNYLWEVMKGAGATAVMAPPGMEDDEVTIEDLIRASVVYGSSATVTEKILNLRQKTGPFGTLLMAGLDGSGPNLDRERSTMRRLAEEVAPAIRRAG